MPRPELAASRLQAACAGPKLLVDLYQLYAGLSDLARWRALQQLVLSGSAESRRFMRGLPAPAQRVFRLVMRLDRALAWADRVAHELRTAATPGTWRQLDRVYRTIGGIKLRLQRCVEPAV